MTTTSRDNQARNGRGKWVRSLVTAERDAEAARLASMGWSYSKIAVELGYSDKGDAHRGARRALADLAQSHGAEELRRQQIEANKALRERLWQIVENPGPLVDRVGRPVHDDDGNPVFDAQAVIAAATTILKCDERIARLAGLDAPRKSITVSVDQGLEQMREAWIREKGYDPLASETKDAYDAWLAGDAPLELGGKLMMPRLSEMRADEREELLSSIREVNQRAAAEDALRAYSGRPGQRTIPGHVVADDI